jgi:hypothetical protein
MAAPNSERIFIITPGRTGSSLLSAILAQAGADFGLPPVQSWNPHLGEMEHPALARATHLYAKANRLAGRRGKPADPLHMGLWALNRNLARRHLARALSAARILKAGDCDLALQPALRLGYQPRVILSYRRLEPIIASFMMRSSYLTVDMILSSYLRCMRNGLAAVALYGGCVVSFEDVSSAEHKDWVRPLAALTELDAGQMLASRESLAKPLSAESDMPCLSIEAEHLWRQAEALRGRFCGTTRPALRLFKTATS